MTNVGAATALVTLLTDPTATCPRATSTNGVSGLIRHGQGNTLILDRVSKEQKIEKGDIIVTQGTVDRRYRDIYPYGIPIGRVHQRRHERHRIVPHGAGRPVRALRLARRRRRTRLDEEAVNGVDGVKAAVLLFVAAILQVSIFSQVHVLGGVPDLLLVTLVAVALLRGSMFGACGGFFAGLLVDTATLGQLGLRRSCSRSPATGSAATARRPAATARTRRSSRSRSSRCSTRSVSCSCTSCSASARRPGAVARGLLPAIALNLILTAPVYALVRRLLPPARPRRLRDRGAAPWLARRTAAASATARAARRRDGRRAVPADAAARLARRRSSARAARSCSRRSSCASGRSRSCRGRSTSTRRRRTRSASVRVPAQRGLDPRPQRRAARHERAGDGGPALAVRPAEGLHRALRAS